MKKFATKAKQVIAGAGLIALTATSNVAEAKESANKEDKLVEKMRWEIQEEDNKKLCSRLPNSKYVLQTREELLKQGVQPHAIDKVHGTCYATIKEPVWTEQIESEIEYTVQSPVGIMTFIQNSDGSLKVQAFANNNVNSEMIITFSDAKSCLHSCPANTRAFIGTDVESGGCECEPVKNNQSTKPVSSLNKANNKKVSMIQSMVMVKSL